MCIAQQGPGVTNFAAGAAAADWAQSPVVFITPESGALGMGLGGFQETEQLPISSNIRKYKCHVNHPKLMAEIAACCFHRAMLVWGRPANRQSVQRAPSSQTPPPRCVVT